MIDTFTILIISLLINCIWCWLISFIWVYAIWVKWKRMKSKVKPKEAWNPDITEDAPKETIQHMLR